MSDRIENDFGSSVLCKLANTQPIHKTVSEEVLDFFSPKSLLDKAKKQEKYSLDNNLKFSSICNFQVRVFNFIEKVK